MSISAKDYIDQFSLGDKTVNYYSLDKLAQAVGVNSIQKLPLSLKILLEGLIRHADQDHISIEDVRFLADWHNQSEDYQIPYHPTRVLMQDFTGVPSVVDLAALRDAMPSLGGNPLDINPTCQVDLVIDHSVTVDHTGDANAYQKNVDIEMQKNAERYSFLKWGQENLENFNVVPPGKGICHQVNIEHLAKVVWTKDINGKTFAFPDSLVGTDSHTTMVNGLGVIGWGVGGIEAESALLGQPISMLLPKVIGVRIDGQWPKYANATDLVLTITQRLREIGVVGKFIEFYGPAIDQLSLPQRATIANMCPEFGATCAFFPIDDRTIEYLRLTGRSEEQCQLVETYCKKQGLWHEINKDDTDYTSSITIHLNEIKPSLAGPKRPQDRVELCDMPSATQAAIDSNLDNNAEHTTSGDIKHGDVVLAAITSCTNTSNPNVMIAAGLLAKKAYEKGLSSKPWVKCSLAPGSRVVTKYLEDNQLMKPLEQLGFYLVGYGCTTCIGNSGRLLEHIETELNEHPKTVSAVLSGNRNFEGRIHPQIRANWLASPPLVVAFAIAGTTHIDLEKDPIGKDSVGQDVYLYDIWPSHDEIKAAVDNIQQSMFDDEYHNIFKGLPEWEDIPSQQSAQYPWHPESTYVRRPTFFDGINKHQKSQQPIEKARIVALLGDSVTTDHISPAGAIHPASPAAHYLKAKGIDQQAFNSYGSRRGNHEVMVRGTFANIRIRNHILDDKEGGFTKHFPSEDVLSIYDACMRYQQDNESTVVLAGKEYGTGSSRDWAAKGTYLLGIKAVIAQSFERIHRSNLIGMGVMPITFNNQDEGWQSLGLTGEERISIPDAASIHMPQQRLKITIHGKDSSQTVEAQLAIHTKAELNNFLKGGILHAFLMDKAQ